MPKTNNDKANNPTEKEIQDKVLNYLDSMGILYVNVKSEALRNRGLRPSQKGIPDLIILNKGRVLFLEIKRSKNYKIYLEQIEWQKKLAEQGFKSLMCYGYNNCINAIENFLAEKPLVEPI